MLLVARIQGMAICQGSASTPAMAWRQCVKMRWQLLVSGAGRARNEAADATRCYSRSSSRVCRCVFAVLARKVAGFSILCRAAEVGGKVGGPTG
jgi:hypothetical protein